MVKYMNLLEKDKVTEVVNRLFISTDNRDWDTVSQIFTSNVLFDMTSMVGGEPMTLTSQEIVTSWEKGLKPLKAIHHQTGNYIITVNKKEADVFCYGIASHYLPNKTNQNTRIFVGSYNFHLIKNGEVWQIDNFKLNTPHLACCGVKIKGDFFLIKQAALLFSTKYSAAWVIQRIRHRSSTDQPRSLHDAC